jgi:hypothetical protein
MGGSATSGYQSWRGPSRVMALAIDAAVSAAQAADDAAFADAITALARSNAEQVAVVLGAVSRDLIERAYPDGLDADDAEQALEGAVRSAAGWYAGLDGDSFIWALTGTLGIGDLDELPPRERSAVVAHGLLLIADLLTNLEQSLAPVLDAALGELLRAQTIELP